MAEVDVYAGLTFSQNVIRYVIVIHSKVPPSTCTKIPGVWQQLPSIPDHYRMQLNMFT